MSYEERRNLILMSMNCFSISTATTLAIDNQFEDVFRKFRHDFFEITCLECLVFLNLSKLPKPSKPNVLKLNSISSGKSIAQV